MNLTNKYNFPEPLYLAVKNDPYTGGGDISTTTLISPPQIVQLKKRHEAELTEDVSDRLYSVLGQLMHLALERAGASAKYVILEKRYFADIEGMKISGQVDAVLEADGTLVDYKLTSVWAFVFGREEWEFQGNVNRWILAQNGVQINKLQNFLLFRDWSKGKADGDKEGGNYPKTQGVTIDLPLWSMEKAEAYIRERVLLHKKAAESPDDQLPECSKEERWEKWNKVKRRVVQGRCESYCPTSAFCQQKKRMAEAS